jgi:hypothetical protein
MSERARFETWNELVIYSPFHSRLLDRYLRGAVLEALGRDNEADGWYASIEEYAAHDAVLLAPALLGRGRISQRAGDHANAASLYSRVLAMLDQSDEEFRSLLDEARERRGGHGDIVR